MSANTCAKAARCWSKAGSNLKRGTINKPIKNAAKCLLSEKRFNFSVHPVAKALQRNAAAARPQPSHPPQRRNPTDRRRRKTTSHFNFSRAAFFTQLSTHQLSTIFIYGKN